MLTTSSSKTMSNPFTPTQSAFHRPAGTSFRFYQFNNPLSINTEHGIQVPDWINFIFIPPAHTIKPKMSSRSLGQLENEHLEEGRTFPSSVVVPHQPAFHRTLLQTFKFFFALAHHRNGYLNTIFTRNRTPYPLLCLTKRRDLPIAIRILASYTIEYEQSDPQRDSCEDASSNSQIHVCSAPFPTYKPSKAHQFKSSEQEKNQFPVLPQL